MLHGCVYGSDLASAMVHRAYIKSSIAAGGTMRDERPTKPLFCCEGAEAPVSFGQNERNKIKILLRSSYIYDTIETSKLRRRSYGLSRLSAGTA